MRRSRPEPGSVRVVCPAWAHTGDPIQLELVGGARFMISVPAGVECGEAFTVRLPPSVLTGVVDEEEPVKLLPVPASDMVQNAVVCPLGKSEGDVISIYPEGCSRPVSVTIPAGVTPGASFMVLLSGANDGKQRRGGPLAALSMCIPTCYVALIWIVVSLNYVVLVVRRAEHLSPAALICGHLVLLLQISSYHQCMRTPPGSVPPSWHAEAAAGRTPFVIDPIFNERIPPRSRYVRRHGAAVLCLDHYCFWLARPIGFFNRKAFVLFLVYSAALAMLGFYLVVADVSAFTPRSLVDWPRLQSATFGVAALVDGLRLVAAALDPSRLTELMLLLFAASCDVLACIGLLPFAAYHVWLVLRNRTSLGEDDEQRYDVGWLPNWRQVFGRQPLWWAVPCQGIGPDGDGLRWPEDPAFMASVSDLNDAPQPGSGGGATAVDHVGGSKCTHVHAS